MGLPRRLPCRKQQSHQIRELLAVSDEEDGHVVPDQVPVAWAVEVKGDDIRLFKCVAATADSSESKSETCQHRCKT